MFTITLCTFTWIKIMIQLHTSCYLMNKQKSQKRNVTKCVWIPFKQLFWNRTILVIFKTFQYALYFFYHYKIILLWINNGCMVNSKVAQFEDTLSQHLNKYISVFGFVCFINDYKESLSWWYMYILKLNLFFWFFVLTIFN